MINTLIVIAKRPEPGRVKTRLVPPFSYQQAALLASAALTDTLAAAERIPARHRLLAFDGSAAGWRRPGWSVAGQPSGDLDVRIVAAFAAAGRGSALLIGMDTPQVSAEHVATFDAERDDAAIGLAADGGYWALGLRDVQLAAAVVLGVPMSRPSTGTRQVQRLNERGLRVARLDTLVDVDTAESAYAVADIAPHTTFAAALRGLDALRRVG